jgi:ABC-type lipoprotein release transport system permease subunit
LTDQNFVEDIVAKPLRHPWRWVLGSLLVGGTVLLVRLGVVPMVPVMPIVLVAVMSIALIVIASIIPARSGANARMV